jgi:hypothetical protein
MTGKQVLALLDGRIAMAKEIHKTTREMVTQDEGSKQIGSIEGLTDFRKMLARNLKAESKNGDK